MSISNTLMLKLHSFEVSEIWRGGMPKFLKKLLYLVPQEAPPDNGHEWGKGVPAIIRIYMAKGR